MQETAVNNRRDSRRARRKKKGKFDYTLFIVMMILLLIGLVMVYSTSYYTANLKLNDPTYYLRKQAFFAVIGIAAMIAISNIDYHWFRNKTVAFFIVVHILLVCVLLFGTKVNGAKRWLELGPIRFQPSEIAKLAVIMFLAGMLNRVGRKIRSLKEMLKTLVWVIPVILLVGIENLSSAIILIAIIGIMIFVDTPRLKPVLEVGAVAILLAFCLFSAKGYRAERISIWLHPEDYDKGFQTLQSLYAIGSGGLTGKGLGQSLQKLGFIPESHNDMIFSILCEELGFIGAIGVIALFLVMIFRMVKIAINAVDLYGSLLVVGVIAHIGIQVLVNIAVVTNTIPNTGVPLPFISYGGTSLCFLFSEMGLVLSVARSVYWEK